MWLKLRYFTENGSLIGLLRAYSPTFSEGSWNPCKRLLFQLFSTSECSDRFSWPHSCGLRGMKWWDPYVAMVSCFFWCIFPLKDERPFGDDYPERLHPDLQPDPSWDNPLPEAPQSCGSGEADGLYFHGESSTRHQCPENSPWVVWPTSFIFCALAEVFKL